MVYMTLVVCLLVGSQYIVPLSESQCKAAHFGDAEDITEKSFSNWHDHVKHNANILFHLAQFTGWLGWLTVAKIMLNPFGEDAGKLARQNITKGIITKN